MVEGLKSGTIRTPLPFYRGPLVRGNSVYAHLYAAALPYTVGEQCNTPTKSPRLTPYQLGTYQRLHCPLSYRLPRGNDDKISDQRYHSHGIPAGERHPHTRRAIMVFASHLILLQQHRSDTPRGYTPFYDRSLFVDVALCSRNHDDDPQRNHPLFGLGNRVRCGIRIRGNPSVVSLFFGRPHGDSQGESASPLPLPNSAPTHSTDSPRGSRNRYFCRMDTPMMTTARKSFLLSLTFHTLMGSLAFWMLTQLTTPPKLVKIPLHHVSLISLSNPTPSPKPQPLQPPLSEKTKPLVQEAQKPLPTKQSVAKEPTVIPKTSPIPSSAPSPETPIRTISTAVPAQPYVAPAPPVVKISPKPDLTAAKRSFFASLRTTIQNHLRYPSAARRRGMEGEIDVRFTLANDGTINTISIQRGESIFHNAVKTAVASASGIDVPKNLTDSLPMEIELTLEFKLNS